MTTTLYLKYCYQIAFVKILFIHLACSIQLTKDVDNFQLQVVRVPNYSGQNYVKTSDRTSGNCFKRIIMATENETNYVSQITPAV